VLAQGYDDCHVLPLGKSRLDPAGCTHSHGSPFLLRALTQQQRLLRQVLLAAPPAQALIHSRMHPHRNVVHRSVEILAGCA
jgi:hypothetical protein